MNKQKAGLILICGMVLGAVLILCAGVPDTSRQQSDLPAAAGPDWSRLKIVTYSSGVTGFFDPDTGKLYLYDTNMRNCFSIHQLTALGKPMIELKTPDAP